MHLLQLYVYICIYMYIHALIVVGLLHVIYIRSVRRLEQHRKYCILCAVTTLYIIMHVAPTCTVALGTIMHLLLFFILWPLLSIYFSCIQIDVHMHSVVVILCVCVSLSSWVWTWRGFRKKRKMQGWGMADLAGWLPAFLTPWRLSRSQPTATVSATSTASSRRP